MGATLLYARRDRRRRMAMALDTSVRLSRDDTIMSKIRGVLDDPLLSVVMPAFNESATIEEIVRRVMALPLRTQLIVVDDASTDGTRESLQRLQQELGFTLLLQPHNQARGAALRRGFEAVRGDLVVIQDADGVFAEEFPMLIELICQGRADVVCPAFSAGIASFSFALPGQPPADSDHEYPLQHDAHRHGDLLQG